MVTVKRLLVLLLAAVMVLSLFAGCDSNTEETQTNVEDPQTTDTTEEVTGSNVEYTGEPQYGGHLNVHVYNQPNGLDPLKQTGLWKYIWTTCVYENALTRDADNQIAPGVCNFEINGDMTELKLWVREGTVFFVGADQNKIHVGSDSETSASTKFTFQLSSQIGRSIVQEFNELTIGKPILHIDVSTNQRVELFHLRHALYVQSVDLINQLLFEFGKLFSSG